ncbi:MAG: transporter substrate-binding domain-containing protein, partial [Gammaproteobacteria bacterium]
KPPDWSKSIHDILFPVASKLRKLVDRNSGRFTVVINVSFALLLILPISLPAQVEQIRVGIYSNPPKVFLDDNGEAAGFWPALTRVIAKREGWQIEWVHGDWEQSLERLRNNRIDVMVDVAVSDSRREDFAFGNQTVHVSWTQVYAAQGQQIMTIPDLQGKRIGGLAESVNLEGPEGLRSALDMFAVEAEIVPMSDYNAVFTALEAGTIDAGVTNRDFGNLMASRFNIIRTPILMQPADLRYAFNRDSPHMPGLVQRFDSHMRNLKQDTGSVYYELQDQWLGLAPANTREVLPVWLKWMLTILLVITGLLGGGLALVEMRVRSRTLQLREQREELRLANERLRHFHQMVEATEDLCGICDASFCYLWVNQAYCDWFDLPRSEIEGLYLWELLGKDYFNSEVRPLLERCLAGEVQRFETERVDKNQNKRRFLVRYYPTESDEGKVEYICAVMTDITGNRSG